MTRIKGDIYARTTKAKYALKDCIEQLQRKNVKWNEEILISNISTEYAISERSLTKWLALQYEQGSITREGSE